MKTALEHMFFHRFMNTSYFFMIDHGMQTTIQEFHFVCKIQSNKGNAIYCLPMNSNEPTTKRVDPLIQHVQK